MLFGIFMYLQKLSKTTTFVESLILFRLNSPTETQLKQFSCNLC